MHPSREGSSCLGWRCNRPVPCVSCAFQHQNPMERTVAVAAVSKGCQQHRLQWIRSTKWLSLDAVPPR